RISLRSTCWAKHCLPLTTWLRPRRQASSQNEINAALKDIAAKSASQEFWITDSSGSAYLTNTGLDFTFSPDPAKQPQASAFWSLLTGDKQVVIQEARKREVDDRVFKYVGVAGIDKPVARERGRLSFLKPYNTATGIKVRTRGAPMMPR